MKFYSQLRPATETSWVVSYGSKTIPRWQTAAILKIDISPSQWKIIRLDEILYTAADFELDERQVIKNEKVPLDRLRVRQNVFLVYANIRNLLIIVAPCRLIQTSWRTTEVNVNGRRRLTLGLCRDKSWLAPRIVSRLRWGPSVPRPYSTPKSVLMGALLHFVQRGGTWARCGPAQSPPRCTKCNSPPINGQCTNHCIAIWWSVALRF